MDQLRHRDRGQQPGHLVQPNRQLLGFCLFGVTSQFPDNSAMEDNQWHHIVVTRSGTTASLYVDGTLISPSLTVSASPLDVDSGGFMVGQDQDTLGGGFATGNSLAGEVDELRVYDRVLTSSEVSTLHSRGH